MPYWVATSFGALDLRTRPEGSEGAEYAVVPTVPGEPLILLDDAAALWRRLAEEPAGVDAASLSLDDRAVLREFAGLGIASPDLSHPSRTGPPPEPWLSSMFHELVYALVANVCREIGVPAVFIKGPVLHAQGLREREHSGDVDVLVAPGCEEKLAHELEAWGWSHFERSALNDSPLFHSIALHAPPRGCEVDVHFRFPGFGVSPDGAFDLVRRQSEQVEFAGARASVPCRSHHATISALHLLRPLPGRRLATGQIEAAAVTLDRVGVSVIDAAHELRATPALAAPLRKAFPGVTVPASDDPIPPDWRWQFAPTVAESFIELLKLVPLSQRPRVMFRLVWPPAEYAMAADAFAGGNARNPTNARVSRLGRGLRQFVSLRGNRGMITARGIQQRSAESDEMRAEIWS
jgi:hypothetical protein